MTISYMTLVQEVELLPLQEQLSLLEILSRLIRASLQPKVVPTDSLTRLRGILRPEHNVPTEHEVADMYVNHLIEKYT